MSNSSDIQNKFQELQITDRANKIIHADIQISKLKLLGYLLSYASGIGCAATFARAFNTGRDHTIGIGIALMLAAVISTTWVNDLNKKHSQAKRIIDTINTRINEQQHKKH